MQVYKKLYKRCYNWVAKCLSVAFLGKFCTLLRNINDDDKRKLLKSKDRRKTKNNLEKLVFEELDV